MTASPGPHDLAEHLLGRRAPLAPLDADGNSRLFRIGDAPLLLKVHRPDGRRAEREAAALRLLERHHLPAPRLVAGDGADNALVMTLEDGAPVTDAGAADADALAAFVEALDALSATPEAAAMPDAADACPTLDTVADHLHQRLRRLRAGGLDDPAAARFLDREVAPAVERHVRAARAAFATLGLAPEAVHAITPSPSDAGLHNALRRPDGGLIFLDFEFFGRDDPAKLVGDLSWHPRALPDGLRERVRERLIARFGGDAFARRLAILQPLFGLAWCMIRLNAFLPDRRVDDAARGDRLARARHDLEWINAHAL